METLIYNLKFFVKILIVSVGPYIWSEDYNTINRQSEETNLESEKIESIDLNTKQDTLVSDTLFKTDIAFNETEIKVIEKI